MTYLLTLNHRISNANNFVQSLQRVDPVPDNLYLWFGRDSAWPDEGNPPAVSPSLDAEFVTRGNIIGAKKVTVTNTCFVAPRYNWTVNTVYAKYDTTDATLFTKNFYVLTSDSNVYKCLNNNNGANSVIQPTGTSTSTISTGDGYQWKFMYNLSSSVVDNFLTADWLPIPTGGQRTAFQTSVESAASYSVGSPVGGHGSNAVEELGGCFVMLSQILDGSEGGVFPVNDDYRQFGFWKNPKLSADQSLATGSVYAAASLNLNSGSILYIENREIITRSTDQGENIYLVLEF